MPASWDHQHAKPMEMTTATDYVHCTTTATYSAIDVVDVTATEQELMQEYGEKPAVTSPTRKKAVVLMEDEDEEEEDGAEEHVPLKSSETNQEAETEVARHKVQAKNKAKTTYVPASTVTMWLGLWFLMNIGVTFWNKKALTAIRLPVTLTFIHMVCNSLGAIIYIYGFRGVERKPLDKQQRLVMASFSFIFVSNIVTGNWSLGLVSITFNQIMRALVPGIVVVLSMLLLGKSYSRQRKITLIPVAYGVYLTCTGDNSATFIGLCITLLAVVFAALKAVLSSKFLTGELKLHPVDLILHQAPLSALWCLIAMMFSGEVSTLVEHAQELPSLMTWYWITGVVSFLLNITSFQANKVTSAVTLSVCANVKQIVVVALSIVLSGDHLTLQKVLGIALVTLGGMVYAYIGHTEMHKTTATTQATLPVISKTLDEKHAQ